MSNEQPRDDYENQKPAPPSAKSRPAQVSGQTPIPIERLVFTAANPNGVLLPHGPTGENVQLTATLKAGMSNNIRVEIDWQPWMRRYKVTRSQRDTTMVKDKAVETYKPLGKPFFIPETWATHVELDL